MPDFVSAARIRPASERILPVVVLIKATAKALADVPELNGYWREDHFEAAESIHIGFAIAMRQGGLVTPAIHDADMLSLDELMAAMRDIITRTRGGRLRSSELTDATITLTSLGDTGVEKVYGVIYPPQVALIGFGKIMDQPCAENGNEVRTYLEGVRRRAACPDCLVRAVIHEGDVAGVIVDTAEEEQVELIVMAPTVREGAARHLLGNITERVLHAVTCPVLIYRKHQTIRRVMIPLDGSELAEKAVTPALEIARRLGASVVLLRVNEAVNVAVATAAEGRLGFESARVVDQIQQASEAYLQSALERFATPGVRIQTAVVDGHPAERILDYAQLVGTDLIPMSTHGRTGLRRWIDGSVSATVMRATTCSVLVIRPEAHELVG